MSLPAKEKPKKKSYPDFDSKFEKIRYTVVMVTFPSIAIFAVLGFVLVNMNFETDYDRTELIVIRLNNTYIANQNSMIRDCEQDARIDYLGGLTNNEIENNLRDCLMSIPFLDGSPNGVEIIIRERNSEI